MEEANSHRQPNEYGGHSLLSKTPLCTQREDRGQHERDKGHCSTASAGQGAQERPPRDRPPRNRGNDGLTAA